MKPSPLPDFAGALFDQGDVAELTAGCGDGFRAGHSAGNELFDFLVEVLADFGGNVVVAAARE